MQRYKVECTTPNGERRVYSVEARDSGQARRAAEKRGLSVSRVVDASTITSKSPQSVRIEERTPLWVWPVVGGAALTVIGLVTLVAWMMLSGRQPTRSHSTELVETVPVQHEEATPSTVPYTDTVVVPTETQFAEQSQPDLAQELMNLGSSAATETVAEEPVAEVLPPASERVPRDPAEIVAEVQDSVAVVRFKGGGGSGFVVSPGLLLTNSHVVDEVLSKDIEIVFPSKSQDAIQVSRIVYDDPDCDLAILEFEGPHGALRIAEDYKFRSGEQVLIMGSPSVGGSIVLKNAVSSGLLSTKVSIEGIEFYQLGASINAGNSGGPVFDKFGDVIGVARSRATNEEALAFAVPADQAIGARTIAAALNDNDRTIADQKHTARVLYRVASQFAKINTLAMSVYVQVMEVSVSGGKSASYGISQIEKETTNLLDAYEKDHPFDEMDSKVRDMLRAGCLDATTYDRFVDFWALVKETRSYARNPRGSLISYRDKLRELESKLGSVESQLQIRLDIRE